MSWLPVIMGRHREGKHVRSAVKAMGISCRLRPAAAWEDTAAARGGAWRDREHAYTDLVLIDGDPLKDLTVLEHPDTALALIMKDGRIFKDRIRPRVP